MVSGLAKPAPAIDVKKVKFEDIPLHSPGQSSDESPASEGEWDEDEPLIVEVIALPFRFTDGKVVRLPNVPCQSWKPCDYPGSMRSPEMHCSRSKMAHYYDLRSRSRETTPRNDLWARWSANRGDAASSSCLGGAQNPPPHVQSYPPAATVQKSTPAVFQAPPPGSNFAPAANVPPPQVKGGSL